MSNQGESDDDLIPATESRGRSTIEFPYLDFDAALEVASAVHTVGGTSCQWNQLAAQMKQAPAGGGFRLRTMAARSFGMITYDKGVVDLTDLGIHLLDPKHAKAARAEAFLSVPLFKAMFERLDGKVLPPAGALERMAEGLGVAPKQKDKARQVFMRSAKQTGYLDLDPDRLVYPANKPSATDGGERNKNSSSSPQGIPTSSDLPPFIQGLLQKLPSADTPWSIEARAKWLITAANIFDLLYSTDEGENKEITIRVEDKK